MCGQPGLNTRPHARLPSNFLAMDAWLTSQLKVALSRKLRGSLMCLAYFCDMLFMGACITRHGQMSGRLVQEFHVCIVHRNKAVINVWGKPHHLSISHVSFRVLGARSINTHVQYNKTTLATLLHVLSAIPSS